MTTVKGLPSLLPPSACRVYISVAAAVGRPVTPNIGEADIRAAADFLRAPSKVVPWFAQLTRSSEEGKIVSAVEHVHSRLGSDVPEGIRKSWSRAVGLGDRATVDDFRDPLNQLANFLETSKPLRLTDDGYRSALIGEFIYCFSLLSPGSLFSREELMEGEGKAFADHPRFADMVDALSLKYQLKAKPVNYYDHSVHWEHIDPDDRETLEDISKPRAGDLGFHHWVTAFWQDSPIQELHWSVMFIPTLGKNLFSQRNVAYESIPDEDRMDVTRHWLNAYEQTSIILRSNLSALEMIAQIITVVESVPGRTRFLDIFLEHLKTLRQPS